MCAAIEIRQRHLVRHWLLLALIGEIDELELERRLIVGQRRLHQLDRGGVGCRPRALQARRHKEDQEQVNQHRDLQRSTE
jgi:hypothetical protein